MPEKSDTTVTLMDNELVVYRRERSSIWQCRYKVDGVWQRATTKERDLEKAKKRARDLMIEAEIRKRQNLPVVTRRFRNVAELAIERMRQEKAAGHGRVSYADYERVIADYLIPFFGKYTMGSINHSLLEEFDQWRSIRMGKAPSQSTLMTQNAALNRVFDEAVQRGFMTDSSRPELSKKGRPSERRAAFTVAEVRALRGKFDDWIAQGRTEDSREQRALLRDYVEMLLDTGARPGTELLDLRWNHITYVNDVEKTPTSDVDEEGQPVVGATVHRSCLMQVDGKTGPREIAGMSNTVKALQRIILRNYGVTGNSLDPFKGIAVASNSDLVFVTKDKRRPTAFQKMFQRYLADHNLLVDPVTGQKRVFYSLRHTYATMALELDSVPIATLTVQMGTSVQMIEKHYSHLKIRNSLQQLRREATKRMLTSGAKIDSMYDPKPPRAVKASSSQPVQHDDATAGDDE